MGSEMIIGIDLGTSNSVAAYISPDGPQLIPNAFGEFLTPSVVGIDFDGALLVGKPAKELQVRNPERCASVFKRLMGRFSKIRLFEREFKAEELSSFVLRSLMADAQEHLGFEAKSAVITVPAYFNEHQRKATICAGKLAGINVERIINEPTAAAIAYGYKELGEEKTLLVFDLGGGTFDVSIVEMFDGVVEVRASSGDSMLGGVDFTAAIAANILKSQGLQFEEVELTEPKMMARVMHQCESAKQKLSASLEAIVRVPDKDGMFTEDSPEVVVSLEQFECWTSHILSKLDMPLRRVFSDTRLSVEKIDDIILVGGGHANALCDSKGIQAVSQGTFGKH